MPYDVGNPGPALGQAHNWIQTSQRDPPPCTLDNLISNGNTIYTQTTKNPTQMHFQPRPHIITKMTDKNRDTKKQ